MAYLPDDLKEKQEGGQDPMNPDGTPQAPGGTGGGSFAGGGGTGSTGAGNSGVAGWTNIQNYLAANEGKSGTSDLAKKEVGDTFSKEQSDFDTAKTGARNQAQAEVDRTNIGQDQASKLLEQATQNYSAKPGAFTGPDLYGEAKGKLQSALDSQYKGPTGFTYGTGAKTQEYGQDLGSDQGWSAIMNSIYDKAAGAPMGAGARALQTQLDSNDPNVQATRQSLSDQYAGLQGNINSGLTDTDAYLQDAAAKTGTGSAAVRDYLNTQAGTSKNALDQKVRAANQHAQDFANILSPQLEMVANAPDDGRSNVSVGVRAKNPATEQNIAGADRERNSWNAIMDALGQNEQQIAGDGGYALDNPQFEISGYPAEEVNGVRSFQDMMAMQFFKDMVNQGRIDPNYFSGGGSLVSVDPRRNI